MPNRLLCIKSAILLLFSTFLLSVSVVGQEKEPNITWADSLHFDFGEIPQNSPVQTRFKFLNNSTEAITIDNVRTTCGCTSPDWEAEVILPGRSSEIKIAFDAKKKGYFRKKIKVYFSNERKAHKLLIEGFVDN